MSQPNGSLFIFKSLLVDYFQLIVCVCVCLIVSMQSNVVVSQLESTGRGWLSQTKVCCLFSTAFILIRIPSIFAPNARHLLGCLDQLFLKKDGSEFFPSKINNCFVNESRWKTDIWFSCWPISPLSSPSQEENETKKNPSDRIFFSPLFIIRSSCLMILNKLASLRWRS